MASIRKSTKGIFPFFRSRSTLKAATSHPSPSPCLESQYQIRQERANTPKQTSQFPSYLTAARQVHISQVRVFHLFSLSRFSESLANISSLDDLAQAIMGGVGAVSDPDWGIVVPCNIKNTLATLSFTFGGSGGPIIKVDISEFVTSLVIPGARAPTFQDKTPACRWGLQPAQPGAPFLFGDTFLRSAYVVYNLQNEQIGIAQTTFNASKANIVEFSGDDIPGASTTVTGLKVTQTYSGHPLQTANTLPTSSPVQIGNNGHPTPTFDLGSLKSAGLRTSIPPRFETASLVTAGVVLLSLICGGSMVFLI